jgi:O-antigen ligase
LIGFIRIYIKNKRDFLFFLKSYIVTAFIIEILILQNFISLGMPFERFTFYGAHPIPLGTIGSITSLIVITLFIGKKISVFSFFVVLISSTWVVMISSSKGPLLSLMFGIILLLPSIFKSIKKGVSLLILCVAVFFFISKTDQYKEMVSRLVNTASDQSTYARLDKYTHAINIIDMHPFRGGGIGVFNDAYPHNVILEVFGEGGLLLGILFFIYIIWIIAKYLVYFFKSRNNFYLFSSLAVAISSLLVLLVSYTFVDLKFLYLGLGFLLVEENLRNPKEGQYSYSRDLKGPDLIKLN